MKKIGTIEGYENMEKLLEEKLSADK